ncbi:MAG: elongation factor G, partial [Candidatus Omnitrophica bacterium CG_4_8_14_3_um_filter_43_15]
MPDYDTDHIRNIVLLSHPQAGKTSVSEAMLFAAGAVSRQGKIDDGSTTSDYLADEIERKGSINLGVLNCMWKSHKINIIDTPGYAEFINDVITAQIAADIAIIVVDAASGIELGTERAWKIISEKRLPALIYINKMDRERADFHKTYEAIVNKFGNKCVVLVAPEGKVLDKKAGEKYYQQLVDTVAEVDDKLVEKYLESGELSPDEIISALKKGVLEGSVIPVVCGSATTNPQADILLDIITEFFPCPSYKTEIKGKTPSSGAEEARKISDTEHFSGQVFKTVVDPYVGQLSIFKIFSGKLMPDTSFYNVSRGASERIGKIFYIQGKSQAPVAKAIAGDIVAVAKLKDTHTGDSISEDKSQILFDPPVFPEPAMSFAVKPKSRADEDKISGALTKLALEDLTFKVNRD